MKATMNCEPERVFWIELSRKPLSVCARGASSDPEIAVANAHPDGGGVGVVVAPDVADAADVVDAAMITTAMSMLCINNPLVPVIERVKEPIEAAKPALTVSMDVAVDAGSGVTGPGRLIETSEGAVPIHE